MKLRLSTGNLVELGLSKVFLDIKYIFLAFEVTEQNRYLFDRESGDKWSVSDLESETNENVWKTVR